MLAEAPADSVCRRRQGKSHPPSSLLMVGNLTELSAATFSRENNAAADLSISAQTAQRAPAEIV